LKIGGQGRVEAQKIQPSMPYLYALTTSAKITCENPKKSNLKNPFHTPLLYALYIAPLFTPFKKSFLKIPSI
jgi:hypothetical protein